jgi:transposase
VPRAAGQEITVADTARLPQFFDQTCDPVKMRTACKCRAYPDPVQQQVLTRTFGCVRVVWNRTLAARQARWHLERKGTSYAESDRALTAMKMPQTGHAIGVDLGVTRLAVTSDGDMIANPRHLDRKAANLARCQRRLARRQHGSANRARAAAKVARAHRKVRHARADFLHRPAPGWSAPPI